MVSHGLLLDGKDFITLNEPIFVNDKRVMEVYANGGLVYPGEYPASIKIITKPSKTQYSDSETINLSGIAVQAYKADGSVWSSGKYPNGMIPLSELLCDEGKALVLVATANSAIPTWGSALPTSSSIGFALVMAWWCGTWTR